MAQLASDTEGFLVAKNKVNLDLVSYKRGLQILMEIRRDTHALRKSIDHSTVAVAKQTKIQTQTAAASRKQSSAIVKAIEKTTSPATVSRGTRAVADKVIAQKAVDKKSPVVQAVKEAINVQNKSLEKLAKRDTKGRFIKRDADGNPIIPEANKAPTKVEKSKWSLFNWFRRSKKDGSNLDDDSKKDNKKSDHKEAVKYAAQMGKEAAVETADTAAQVDATAAATKEVAGLFSPIAKIGIGFGRLIGFGKDKDEKTQEKVIKKFHVPWYKKIIKAIGLSGDDSGGGILGAIGKVISMLLSPLGAAGLFGVWAAGIKKAFGEAFKKGGASIVKSISSSWKYIKKPVAELLGSVKNKSISIAKAGLSGLEKFAPKTVGFLKNAGAKTIEYGSKALKIGSKGFGALKKVPVLGTLLSLGQMGYGAWGGNGQTKKDRGRNIGAGAGTMIGGAIGGVFGGVPGAIIGSIIGDLIGEKVGEWLATFDWKSFGDKISAPFIDAGNFIKEKWKDVTDYWGRVKGGGSALAHDVGEKATGAYDKVKSWFNTDPSTTPAVVNPDKNSSASSLSDQIAVTQISTNAKLDDSVVKLNDSVTSLAGIMNPTAAPVFPRSIDSTIMMKNTAAPSTNTKIPDQTPSTTKLAGNGSKTQAPVNVSLTAPIGQNLSDRNIAHVATGGMSAYSTGR